MVILNFFSVHGRHTHTHITALELAFTVPKTCTFSLHPNNVKKEKAHATTTTTISTCLLFHDYSWEQNNMYVRLFFRWREKEPSKVQTLQNVWWWWFGGPVFPLCNKAHHRREYHLFFSSPSFLLVFYCVHFFRWHLSPSRSLVLCTCVRDLQKVSNLPPPLPQKNLSEYRTHTHTFFVWLANVT